MFLKRVLILTIHTKICMCKIAGIFFNMTQCRKKVGQYR